MIEKQIETFYKNSSVNLNIVKKVEGLQLTTFFSKIDIYDTKIINKILKLQNALCLYLKIDNINIKQDNKSGCIVFEIPKKERDILSFKDLQKDYIKDTNGLYVNIGKDTQNNIYKLDLCRTPHLLISGTTGSGKSVFINTILTSLLLNYSPSELELILIDVKQVEFSIYKNIPHLLYETITNYEDTKIVLNDCIEDINKRYEILKENNCRNIQEYNKLKEDKMKYRLIVIDELAELFMIENKSKLRADIEGIDRIENTLCRIAQIGRASGVHLILATQRPSTDVITGLLKSNIPSRVCLTVSSSTDSKVILDTLGAEKLTGKGDLLLKLIGNNDLIRLQSAFIEDKEQLDYIEEIKERYILYNNNISNILEQKKEQLKSLIVDKEKVDNILEQNIRYLIENSNNYEDVKRKVYSYDIRDRFIEQLKINNKEKEYAKNIYLKTCNNIFKDYDKIYKLKEKQDVNIYKKRNKKIQLYGILYCISCGIYGLVKGNKKSR